MPEPDITPRVVHRPNLHYRQWLGLILMLLAGVYIGRYLLPGVPPASLPTVTIDQNGERQIAFPTFWEAWDRLHEKFIGDLSDDTLMYGAVSGMISAAGDPYTVFADPDATKQFNETLGGSFSGIGVEMGMRNGAVTVIAPLDGSPAQTAGIREGDIIVAVDDTPLTQDTTLDEVVQKIRGARSTKVKLTVLHKGDQETAVITITRDTIHIDSVKLDITDNIARITVTSFNEDTASQFLTAARQITRQSVSGIILDLRNNPGGFLQSAVDIASRFIPEGQLIVSERGTDTTEYKAEGNDILNGIPLVVLVNEGSASSSEILSGALRDNLQASIIGTTTFGKGSVQELIKLKDGSSLRVTVAKWFTPSDHNINESGIEPDIQVEQNYDTTEDEPLLRATEEITKLINNAQ
ncbi:MAG: S41 family peptidase [bacterium]|nr:S41 family peptidase [bacterium]MDZ4343342.1 S41 family peptidase [Candidatus Binatia bacterium]